MAGAGAATADLVYATLAVTGGNALVELVDPRGGAFRIASGVVLIAIAVVGLLKSRSPEEAKDEPMPNRNDLIGTYVRFLGLTIINPTTIVYFAAIVVGLGVAAELGAVEGTVFAAAAFLASLAWQTMLALAGTLAGKRMSPNVQRTAIVVGNLLILALAVAILLG
jgi:arginine exporter protein ArgO